MTKLLSLNKTRNLSGARYIICVNRVQLSSIEYISSIIASISISFLLKHRYNLGLGRNDTELFANLAQIFAKKMREEDFRYKKPRKARSVLYQGMSPSTRVKG